MTKISKSPERNTFQKQTYLIDQISQGKSMEDPDVKAMIDWYESWDKLDIERETDLSWRQNNLEYDLRSTDWILEKVRNSEIYSQNLYAALCNNDFVKHDIVEILKENYWGCSWRSAGGIIANMRQEGDYIDWYCSGIKNDMQLDHLVGEGFVTDEINEDLLKLGWTVVTNFK